jgi:hypothetical protein
MVRPLSMEMPKYLNEFTSLIGLVLCGWSEERNLGECDRPGIVVSALIRVQIR